MAVGSRRPCARVAGARLAQRVVRRDGHDSAVIGSSTRGSDDAAGEGHGHAAVPVHRWPHPRLRRVPDGVRRSGPGVNKISWVADLTPPTEDGCRAIIFPRRGVRDRPEPTHVGRVATGTPPRPRTVARPWYRLVAVAVAGDDGGRPDGHPPIRVRPAPGTTNRARPCSATSARSSRSRTPHRRLIDDRAAATGSRRAGRDGSSPSPPRRSPLATGSLDRGPTSAPGPADRPAARPRRLRRRPTAARRWRPSAESVCLDGDVRASGTGRAAPRARPAGLVHLGARVGEQDLGADGQGRALRGGPRRRSTLPSTEYVSTDCSIRWRTARARRRARTWAGGRGRDPPRRRPAQAHSATSTSGFQRPPVHGQRERVDVVLGAE